MLVWVIQQTYCCQTSHILPSFQMTFHSIHSCSCCSCLPWSLTHKHRHRQRKHFNLRSDITNLTIIPLMSQSSSLRSSTIIAALNAINQKLEMLSGCCKNHFSNNFDSWNNVSSRERSFELAWYHHDCIAVNFSAYLEILKYIKCTDLLLI